MPLKEKAAIANLDEDKVPCLQDAFDAYVKDQLLQDYEMSKDVSHWIWEVLQKMHWATEMERLEERIEDVEKFLKETHLQLMCPN